jgi:hypothetical protein
VVGWSIVARIPGVSLSLNDFLDFVLLWIKQRSGVHQGELTIYPAMVRHCLCCQENATYAHRTNGLCLKCCEEQVCLLCSEEFTPSLESVGVFCPSCWSRLEKTWTTTFVEQDPIRAEAEIRSAVAAARPKLSGCRHRD